MNILKRLRKPSLSIILASLVLFYSCNKEGFSVEDEPQYTDLTEFVNVNLSNNNFDARVNSVNHFKLEDYSKYTDKIESISKNNNNLDDPYSLAMNFEGRDFNLHTVPISENVVSVFIESEDGEFNEIVELSLGAYDESTDQYELFWNYTPSENLRNSYDIDCFEGAGATIALGNLISLGALLGRAPCAFIGRGFVAVGSALLIGCIIMAL